MKRLFGTLLMLTLITFLLSPEAIAQRGNQDRTKNKQDQRGQRGRKGGRKKGARKGRSGRSDDAPKVGDVAPTFTLKSMDGESETDLADFNGEKPVVLFFGSYT